MLGRRREQRSIEGYGVVGFRLATAIGSGDAMNTTPMRPIVDRHPIVIGSARLISHTRTRSATPSSGEMENSLRSTAVRREKARRWGDGSWMRSSQPQLRDQHCPASDSAPRAAHRDRQVGARQRR
jgi:hypothetical protein